MDITCILSSRVFLGDYDVSSICSIFVSCFVHILHLAGMSFNNIDRLKKQKKTCILSYISKWSIRSDVNL